MSMLVSIYTFADKRPDFIRWHHATFSRYVAGTHELLLDGTFFHYRSGSDWNLRSEVFHTAKTVLAEALLRSVEDEHRSDERVRADAAVILPRASLSMRLRYLWQAVLAGTVDRWFT